MWHIDLYGDSAEDTVQYLFINVRKYSTSERKNIRVKEVDEIFHKFCCPDPFPPPRISFACMVMQGTARYPETPCTVFKQPTTITTANVIMRGKKKKVKAYTRARIIIIMPR